MSDDWNYISVHNQQALKSRHPTIGSLLRSLRKRKDWTLKEMSQHSGIPMSTLSRVEHDRLTLTYDKLQQVSERLNIPFAELLAEPDNNEVSVTARRSIGSIEDAVRINTPNYDYYYYCAELRRKRLIPLLVYVRAKSIEDFGELIRHSGEEYAHVLEGRIVVHTEFYDPVELEVGQSIYIDSKMGHAFIAGAGCEKAVILCVCASADESLVQTLLNQHADRDAQVSSPPQLATLPARPKQPAPRGRHRPTRSKSKPRK